MLCNSEAWYNLTISELNLLETVDEMLLRKLLNTPKSTPKEMLYLELGCIPYRILIKKRRLMFLFYILKQDPQSLIYKFFQSQKNHETSKDWVTTIRKDLKELNINMNFDDIQSMKKSEFKKMINQKIEMKTKNVLNEKKSNHSKVKNLQHNDIGIRKYLKHGQTQILVEERQLIFKLRTQMTNVKMNFRGMYDSFQCEICYEEDESQQHIMECRKLNEISHENIPDYTKIENGNLSQMVAIARKFKRNIEIRDMGKKEIT